MELESMTVNDRTHRPRKSLEEQDIPNTGTDVLMYLANEGHAGLSSGDLAEL